MLPWQASPGEKMEVKSEPQVVTPIKAEPEATPVKPEVHLPIVPYIQPSIALYTEPIFILPAGTSPCVNWFGLAPNPPCAAKIMAPNPPRAAKIMATDSDEEDHLALTAAVHSAPLPTG